MSNCCKVKKRIVGIVGRKIINVGNGVCSKSRGIGLYEPKIPDALKSQKR